MDVVRFPRTGGSGASRVPDNVAMGSFLRRPLGIFAAILVVGFALIALGMEVSGGTSGGSPRSAAPLSPAEFQRTGERICLSLRSQLRWLAAHKPTSLRQVTRFIARGTSVFDGLTAKVDRLVPPPAAAASIRRLRTNLGVADRALHHLDHLTETHQWRRAVLLVRSRWWKNIGKRFGPPTKLKNMDCGQGGRTPV
jgi:hypothetical protein